MAANVRIEDDAFNDPRIGLLGDLAGYNRFEALGRLAHLWRICTQREAYVLEESWIVATLGEKGPEAMLKAGLGEKAEGGIRVKGTKGRIEWIQKLRANAGAGGRAAKVRRLALLESSKGAAEGVPSGTPGDGEKCQKEPQKETQTPSKAVPEVFPSTSSLLPSEEEEASPRLSLGEPKLKKPAKKKTGPESVPIPANLDTPAFRVAWADWIAYRAEKNKELTAKAAELNFESLATLNPEQAIACIHASIAGAWTGLFPEKITARPASGRTAPLLNPSTAKPMFQRNGVKP